jgi:DNA ligase (NAD+)
MSLLNHPLAGNEAADGLANLLRRYNHLYYNYGCSPVSDEEFDHLKRQLRELNPQHPALAEVGAPAPAASHLSKAQHRIHMGSVANAMNDVEFMKWYDKNGRPPALASVKADGLSVNLEYVNGLFQRAITRGDGAEGEDVTANVIKARYLPLAMSRGLDFTGSVRAEIMLFKEDWQEVDPDAANPRNAVSGTTRRKSGEGAEFLRILAHSLTPDPSVEQDERVKGVTTMAGAYRLLQEAGFTTPWHQLIAGGKADAADQARDFYLSVEAKRPELEYEIDGVVYSVNDLETFHAGGIDGEACYRCQIAWKFEAQTAETHLTGVELTVGHTGAITPTAILDPVEIGGVTVTRASLHNLDLAREMGLGYGDKVLISRQGDVIPQVQRVITKATPHSPIKRPTACPNCRGPVGRRVNVDGEFGAMLYCQNAECPSRVRGKIGRWIRSLNILGIGDELLMALTEGENPLVKTVRDLYDLTPEKLDIRINGRRLGVSRATKIVAELEKTRQLTIDQLLGSLGLPLLGKRRVQIIREACEKHFGQNTGLNELQAWFTEDGGFSFLKSNANLLGLPGTAEEIQKGLDDAKPLITRMLEVIQLTGKKKETVTPTTTKLSGRAFCLTGAMSRKREEIAADIIAAGGTVKSDVSKGVTLVQADPSSKSSKSEKAKKLGSEILSEEQLMALMT